VQAAAVAGAVVEVVVVDEPFPAGDPDALSQSVVAWLSSALACAASRSSCCWSAVRACCSLRICGLLVLPWVVPASVAPVDAAVVGVVGTFAAVAFVVPDEDEELGDELWLASSLANVALADARVAAADVTLASSEVMSKDASVWPETTFCPTETSTELTVPDTLKFRSARLTGVIVPTESSVWIAVPVVTAAVR